MSADNSLLIRENCDGTCNLVEVRHGDKEEDMGSFPNLRRAIGTANWHMRNHVVEHGLSIKLYGDDSPI